MKNQASKTRTLDIAFVVTPDLLKRLAVILSETSKELEYTVKYSDGTTIRYDAIEDITGQANSDERSIVSLIAGTANEAIKSAYVNLKKKDTPSLEYTINGTQRDVIYFADQLDDWVAAIRQWYSPLFSSTSDFPSFAASAIIFLCGFILPWFVWEQILHFLPASFRSGGSLAWVGAPAWMLMWVGEFWLFKLFPRGTFAIGQGEKRHQFFIYIRRTVLFGSLLSIIIRVLWVWFTKHA